MFDILILGGLAFGCWITFAIIKYEIAPRVERSQKKRKKEQEAAERQRIIDEHPVKWRQAGFLSTNHFATTLLEAYFQIHQGRATLKRNHLNRLVAVFAQLYEVEFPKEPPALYSRIAKKLAHPKRAYDLAFRTCLI